MTEKWDYELLSGLSKCMKPQYPEEYHSPEQIKRHTNSPVRIIQQTVKEMLRTLPPEVFIGRMEKQDGKIGD